MLHCHPDLGLTTELVPEPASKALLERCTDASALVLGSRGHGSPAGFLLGSISLHVLGLAPCPAVAVRAGDLAVEESCLHPAAEERDAVVGVPDPVSAADPVLEFAFTAAQASGVGVRAVQARAHEAEAEERALFGAALAPWREKFPDVPVVEQAVTGSVAQALVTGSARSRLTVIGRRRHTSPLAWKLGPVAHTVLHHAKSPVAIVPHG
ncbi:universal stress protein [Streptomyces sp. NPDC088387]|uniref:universal stress protein n=1 Tax=Streptomyces sp. NPDC088387 TaxID=3365859 RepID=UPI003806F07B